MAFGNNRYEWIHIKQLRAKNLVERRFQRPGKTDVDQAVDQSLRLHAWHYVRDGDADTRTLAAEILDDRGDVGTSAAVKKADSERAALATRGPPDHFHRMIRGRKHLPCLGQKDLTL